MAPGDSNDLTPAQLASFYKAVGGDYDPLFVGTPPASIAFIYRSLGCRHSLQPADPDDDFATPSIPALKPKGFVTWQTIQLLLYPEEHVPFIQKAVADFDIKDPETGQFFPKLLPGQCLPRKPDEQMIAWYEAVSQRLMREAEMEGERNHVEKEDQSPRATGAKGRRDFTEMGSETGHRPHHRYEKSEIRSSKDKSHKPWLPFGVVEEKGRIVASTVKHLWDYHPRGHRGNQHGYVAPGYPSQGRYATSSSPRGRSRPSHMRRHSTSSTRSSSVEDEFRTRRGHSQDRRSQRRKSHEPLSSPRYDGKLRFSETLKPSDGRPSRSRNTSSGPEDSHRYHRRSMPTKASHNLYQERPGPLHNHPSHGRPSVVSYSRADYDPSYSNRGRHVSSSHVEKMPRPVGQRAEFGTFAPGLDPNRERPPMKPYSYTSPPVNENGGSKPAVNTAPRR